MTGKPVDIIPTLQTGNNIGCGTGERLLCNLTNRFFAVAGVVLGNHTKISTPETRPMIVAKKNTHRGKFTSVHHRGDR